MGTTGTGMTGTNTTGTGTDLAHDTETEKGAGTGATIGTVLGGGAGLLAGIGSLAIPGVGPVVAAGWLIAPLTGAGQRSDQAAGVPAAARTPSRSVSSALARAIRVADWILECTSASMRWVRGASSWFL